MPDLPVLDDLEVVLRTSEAHITPAAPRSSLAPKPTHPVPPPAAPKKADTRQWAREKSIGDVEVAFEAVRPNMAMDFPFELDSFQKEGVVLMERAESVFVAAHTSAGAFFLYVR